VLELYADESESSIVPLMLIGGWTADVDCWAEFSVRWQIILNKYNVAYFHSHTFRNARSQLYRHLDKFERDSMLISLLLLIKEFATFGQIAWVKPKLYNRITTKEFRNRHGTAYASLLGYVVAKVGINVTNHFHRKEVVSVFLESGHRHANEALHFIKQAKLITSDFLPDSEIVGPIGNSGLRFSPFKIGVISLGEKAEMKPLQAADILAYCSLCLLRNANDGFAKAVLAAIDLPIYKHHLDEDCLQQQIEILRRTDAKEQTLMHNRRVQIKELRKLGVDFQVLPDGISVIFDHDDILAERIRKILGTTNRSERA
jgi:hypothetical protein